MKIKLDNLCEVFNIVPDTESSQHMLAICTAVIQRKER